MEITIKIDGQAVSVEVSMEVYAYLKQADRKMENLAHEQRRHWDGREFDEYIIATEGIGAYGETPKQHIYRMETLSELMAILDACTEVQRRRFLLYALDGLNIPEQEDKFNSIRREYVEMEPSSSRRPLGPWPTATVSAATSLWC